MTPQGIYGTALAFSALFAVAAGVYTAKWAIQGDVPLSIVVGLGLGGLGHVLGGYRAWLALRGAEPVDGDRLSFMTSVLGIVISLLLVGPPLWSALQK